MNKPHGVPDCNPLNTLRHLLHILNHRRGSAFPPIPKLINRPGQAVIGQILTRRNTTTNAGPLRTPSRFPNLLRSGFECLVIDVEIQTTPTTKPTTHGGMV